VIEAQLAHSVRDSLGRAYNRTEFVERDKLLRGAITRAARLAGQATARVNAPASAFVGFTLIWMS
jgi:hypothetical protein